MNEEMRKRSLGGLGLMVFLLGVAFCSGGVVLAQGGYTLKDCLGYALEHNRDIRKSAYDLEKSRYARREVLGALLPQVNGSANLNDNLKKAKFVMPNFMNNMLPPNRQDPNASKYITVEMGTKYTANGGVALNQQLLNFSLFNALNIAKEAERLAALGRESTEEEVIAQTAALFYGVQSTEYAATQMGKSVALMERMLRMMEVNHANGLVKKVDVDRLRVNLTNLRTQESAIANVVAVQKNLLKLQMGLDMDAELGIVPMDLGAVEQEVGLRPFLPANHTAYRLLSEQERMVGLQRRSAIYEYLPTLSVMLNFQYNGVSDQFFRGEMNHWYPTSMVGLSLRVPIFSGMSRHSKVKQSGLELLKVQEDRRTLEQSLSMAYKNARAKLGDAHRTIDLQRENQALAEEVFEIAQNNFVLGVASLSDVLNASQSLIQARMSYADAVNDYLKATIDLRKANGTIRELIN